MPAGWSCIKPALIEVFSGIAKTLDAPFKGEWSGRARSQISDLHKFALLLTITSVRGIGRDELRFFTDEESGEVTEAVVGQRVFILRVEAHALDDTDQVHALHVLERIRTRLRRSRVIAALDEVDVGVNTIGTALDTSYRHTGRTVPRATLDVTLNTSASEDDPIPIGVIAHVEWTGTVDGNTSAPEMTPPLEP